MTRDLPFDGTDDTEVDEAASDTAYRVATGVARVARAGAYVTGGALIASNGGGVPARPGDARLDSFNSGWAYDSDPDPDPDVPSPVVTFPDPEPNWDEPAPVPSQQLPPAPGPLEQAPAQPNWMDTDSRASWQPGDAYTPGWYGTDVPTEPEWLETETTVGPTAPSELDWLEGPSEMLGGALPGHTLPGHGNPFAIPGTQAFGGANFFDLPKIPTAGDATAETPDRDAGSGFDPGVGDYFDPGGLLDGNPWDVGSGFGDGSLFDGVGGGSEFGVFLGIDAEAALHTEFTVDFGINEQDGLYFYTNAKVEASAELSVKTAAGTNVGDQLDQLSDWLDSKPAPGTGSARTTNEQAGTANSGVGTGAAHGPAPVAAQPAAPGLAAPAPAPVAPAAVAPAHAPAAQPAPAPAAPAPIAPAAVAPVAMAPAVVAPVAVQPVVATPLQTTIQPEAASTPIANVLVGPNGGSPLTAPAAVAPTLFDPPKPAHPGKLDPKLPDTGHPGTDPVTKTPTTVTNTIPTPSTGATTDPTTVKTPDPSGGVTKIPGSTVTLPGTDVDGTPTKIPGATTTPTAPTKPAPSTDPDVTKPSVPTTQQPTQTQPKPADPTHTRPTADTPTTADVPTVSMPSQPSHSAPTPTVDMDPPSVHVPTQAPVTPVKPPVTVNPKPISDNVDYQVQYPTHSDHLLYASGLSGGLLPHDPALPHHDGTDITLV
ncbi:hypothetical protein [Nocardia sp. NPDC050435]|uniref:hypothetical protein n=1 Tax=Nocardia sp. NPDC050435 TaxID=3155040 RepID=UPI003401A2D7